MKVNVPNKKSELLSVLLSFRGAFLYVCAFSFIINMVMLVPSLYMLQVYDRVLASRNTETLLMLTLIVLGLYLFMGGLEWVRTRVLVRLGAKLDMALNGRVFQAAFESNLNNRGANAGQAMHDLSGVRQFLTGNGVIAMFDAPWAPIYLAVVFLLHPLLGFVSLAGMVLLVILTLITEKVTKSPLEESNKEGIAANNFVATNLRNAEVIESMGMLAGVRHRWFARHGKMLSLQAVASDRAGAVSATSKFIQVSIQSLILGAGALLAIDGTITPGAMIAGSILMGRAMAPVQMAMGSWKQFLAARTSYNRLSELLSSFPLRKTNMSLPKPKGQMTVSGLIAVPPGSQITVLHGVNFEVAPGDVVGVVGPSASGKSSLARLLVGVWRPHGGSVRLDGAEVSQWNKAELGPSIGYLPQDIELFDGTISENIARFGEINSELVIEAAQMAGVHEMILHLPQGYDTLIGANTGLSGGQRQRIGLARALYGVPALVVLDEPNSNLDEAGEAALVAAIRALKVCGSTVFLITHRTSVISVVDKLLVLQAGASTAFGSRDEVLSNLQRSAAQLAPKVSAQGGVA